MYGWFAALLAISVDNFIKLLNKRGLKTDLNLMVGLFPFRYACCTLIFAKFFL